MEENLHGGIASKHSVSGAVLLYNESIFNLKTE